MDAIGHSLGQLFIPDVLFKMLCLIASLFICHIQRKFVAEWLCFHSNGYYVDILLLGYFWVVQWPNHTSKTISNGL